MQDHVYGISNMDLYKLIVNCELKFQKLRFVETCYTDVNEKYGNKL